MAKDIGVGPWPSMDMALDKGGAKIKEVAAEHKMSVHGYVAIQRPSDGKWGIRGLISGRFKAANGRSRPHSIYLKAGVDRSCGHPKRYVGEQG